MKINFECHDCGHTTENVEAIGWTDGCNFIIMKCPHCGEEKPTIEDES